MDSCGGSPCQSQGNNQEDHTWLAFSLSNHHYYTSSSPHPTNSNSISNSNSDSVSHSHSQQQYLSLFQHHHPPPSPGEVGDVVENGGKRQEEEGLPLVGGTSDGMLHVGLFPAVTVAGNGGGVGYEAVSGEDNRFLGGFTCDQQMQIVQHGGAQQRIILSDANNQQPQQPQQQLAMVAPVLPSGNKKGAEGFGQRTSIYRGVTRHRWTGRYEAHLWDNSCRREGQSRKGRQVYLGGYDKEEKAARAYDLAALKYWGPTTTTNFPISDYEKELEEMKNMSRQEFVASLRRKSSGFSRGASIYRGVTRHHQHGRWQARIGRVAGNKDLYLGTFSTQEEAAEAYDIAAIKFRGLNAVTNFDISRYDVKSIISSNLPVGGMSNKSKSISDPSALDTIKALPTTKPNSQDFNTSMPLTTNPTPKLDLAIPIKATPLSQTYGLPSLGTMEHSDHHIDDEDRAIGYGLEYGNDSVSEGYDSNNGYDNGNNGGSSNGSGNSWIVTQNLHSFQTPKPRLSVLHRSIFGIE